jgi:glycosyltransferase involved in cell wall biosynthesis
LKPLTVIFFSNFLDERTRILRNITTDSPAASRKVLNACEALRVGGARPIILSMGRGRTNGGREAHGWAVGRVGQVPVVYAPFRNYRCLSEAVSMLAPALFIFRRRKNRRALVLLYNRTVFGVLPMLVARLVGWPAIIDLEDGEILQPSTAPRRPHSVVKQFARKRLMRLYDRFCQRAILAATALEASTSVRPTMPYYGSIKSEEYHQRTSKKKVSFLFSGTVTSLTGSTVLSEALTLLVQEQPAIVRSFVLHVTGSGDGIAELQRLATALPELELHVHGRVNLADYKALLLEANVGLSLKKVAGQYADTTFPSKTVEYAAAGLYVISTDISDVRRVLGEDAAYLSSNDPRELAAAIAKAVALGPSELEHQSRALQGRINQILSLEKSGRDLISFLEEAFESKR